MPLQKCAAGTEAASDALRAIINKALGCPRIGLHIGQGRHVAMPPTWDDTGSTPPGWTKHAVMQYVANAANSWVAITDAESTELQLPQAQALLTGPEVAALAIALAGRVTVDPEAQGGSPKAGS